MSQRREQVYLGSFVVGEVPVPLEYQFLDANGSPINLTGFGIVHFQWGEEDVSGEIVNPVDRVGVLSDAVNGTVQYAWIGDEFATTGGHAGIFFTNNGSTQYASILITWQVCASITTPPTV